MNYGELDGTKTTRQMYLLTLSLEYWRWFPHGLESTVYKGMSYQNQHPTFDLYICRDIPLPLVTSGCENSGNLRELALNRMKDFGAECRDVRFREVGVCLQFCYLPTLRYS